MALRVEQPDAFEAADFTVFDLEHLGRDRAYHWLNGLVVPRPVAFVTTVDEEGRVNAAPFSYFNVVCPDPPMLSVSISRRGDAPKDTLRNVQATGELVINATTRGLAAVASAAAGDYPPEVSEVDLLGLVTGPSQRVAPPRLLAAPWQIECRLERAIDLGASSFTLLVVRGLLLHVHPSIIGPRGRVDPAALDPVGRLAGRDFACLGEILSIPRGLPAAGRVDDAPGES